jgi:flavin reductase (DIM6/NTAB) family NADH-FMN oxidoreductase RutF
MKQYDISEIELFDKHFRTNFVNSLWGFKSVNLIGTQNKGGNHNLAIFSQVFHLGANPALVGLIVRPPESERHTYENIKETGCFSINHIHPGIAMAAHQTAARYERTLSEFDAVGLTPYLSHTLNAPYVAESRLRIGCDLVDELEIKQNGTVMIIGQVKEVWVGAEAVKSDGYIDIEELQTITSSNIDSYHTTTRIMRLSYAKPNKQAERI